MQSGTSSVRYKTYCNEFDIKNILRKFEERGGAKILDFLLRLSILCILIGILFTKGCNSKDSYIDQDIINKRKKVEKELDALEMTKDIKQSVQNGQSADKHL